MVTALTFLSNNPIILILMTISTEIKLPFAFFLSVLASLILLDFSLTVKAATLIFISGCGSAISSAKEGKSGFIYNLVKS